VRLKDTSGRNVVVGRIGRILTSHKTLLVLVYSCLLFFTGVFVHRSGLFWFVVRPLVRNGPQIVRNRIKGMWASPERIVIDIKHMDFQRLAYEREIALSRGMLITGPDSYVPARIRNKDGSVRVKLRLKGDALEHLEGKKWSFRIKVTGDNTLFGMKRFSIHHPGTREYIYEWLLHRALKREGVLSLRYEFIAVTLNGKDMGVYALEEHFGKRLVEHNGRRDGPIVRFGENLIWAERVQQTLALGDVAVNGCGRWTSSHADAFQTSKHLADPAMRVLHGKAIHLLEAFRREKLTTSQVFDIQKLARYFAISDLLRARHGCGWTNARFYYNPITSRLEPIGFDGDSKSYNKKLSGAAGSNDVFTGRYYRNLFSDRAFFREYLKTLVRVSQRAYLDELLADLDAELERNLAIIYSQYPSWQFSRTELYRNQEYIRTVLEPIKGIHAYFHNASKDRVELELGNIQSLPIEVLGASYNGSAVLRPDREIVLCGKGESDLVDYQVVGFALPDGFAWSDAMVRDLKVNYQLLGTGRVRDESVFSWSHLPDDFVETDFIRQAPNVETFDFLVIDRARKRIFIKPGSWDLRRNMIIPKGYMVICGAGTELDLSGSAKVLSYSPVEFRGTADEPIIIRSTGSDGQGLAVMSADGKSVLEHVNFVNLSNPSENGWELTGAVTFYESAVRFFRCQFIESRSEDGLNIVGSRFTVEKCVFSGTRFDAFDADFCRGRIVDTLFMHSGNDAIDVSGSVVTVRNVRIKGAGDKGLSCGENSRMTANDIEVSDAAIAVASKDLSETIVKGARIRSCRIGLAVYQKKSEFGPGSITARSVSMTKTGTDYLVEEKSSLDVNGHAIRATTAKAEETLYASASGG